MTNSTTSWYAVRIDNEPGVKATIVVESMPDMAGDTPMFALDSTPAVMAVLRAEDPARAAVLAWDWAKGRNAEGASKPELSSGDLVKMMEEQV